MQHVVVDARQLRDLAGLRQAHADDVRRLMRTAERTPTPAPFVLTEVSDSMCVPVVIGSRATGSGRELHVGRPAIVRGEVDAAAIRRPVQVHRRRDRESPEIFRMPRPVDGRHEQLLGLCSWPS